MVTPADMTDRNAAREVLFRLRLMHPEITIAADSAYAGQLVTWAKTYLSLTIKTVSRPKDTPGFVVLPLGRRTLPRLDHARPQTRSRLRTPHPALGIADHLGGNHPHDQAHHPPKLLQKRTAGPPRRTTRLIIPGFTAVTLTKRSSSLAPASFSHHHDGSTGESATAGPARHRPANLTARTLPCGF
jgi:hypothetical protein